MHDEAATDTPSPQAVRRWFTEFVYGTVTAMVAVAGILAGHETSSRGAIAIVVVGALTVWFAHAYCKVIGSRMASGRGSYGRDLLDALSGSWPIVTAGGLLAAPLVVAALGLWSLELALWISTGVGVVILAIVGVLAGVSERATWPVRILLVALSCGMGLAVVAVEVLAHY